MYSIACFPDRMHREAIFCLWVVFVVVAWTLELWPFEHRCAEVWKKTDAEIDLIVNFWDTSIFGNPKVFTESAAGLGYVKPETESYFDRLERGRRKLTPELRAYFSDHLRRFIKKSRQMDIELSVEYDPNETFREFL